MTALPEGKAAATNNPDGISYEFTSDGYQGQGVYGDNTIVSLSYLYGYTGYTKSRIVGYYTHSEGTYSDLELHDLGETHANDYLASPGTSNYQAKVQYQLDGEDKWYDANFFYMDGEGILKMKMVMLFLLTVLQKEMAMVFAIPIWYTTIMATVFLPCVA